MILYKRDVRCRILASALVLVLAGGLTVGCGGAKQVQKGDVAHGQLLLMNGEPGKRGCVYCHTIAAAGAQGPYAPNLDTIYRQEWKPAGEGEADIRQQVYDQIMHPAKCVYTDLPDHCMPTGVMTGQNAIDVASFVAQCVGWKGIDGCRPDNGGLAPGSLEAKGWRLYTQFRCAGCHSTNGNAPGPDSPTTLAAAVGPSFKGLYGSMVNLTSGQTVTADDGYLTAAIAAPDAQIVQGYRPGVMTEIIPAGALKPAQIRALIAYIKTLK